MPGEFVLPMKWIHLRSRRKFGRIRSANTVGMDAQEYFARGGPRPRNVLNTNVARTVIHGRAHRYCHLDPVPGAYWHALHGGKVRE